MTVTVTVYVTTRLSPKVGAMQRAPTTKSTKQELEMRRSEAVHILVDCGYDALMSEDERKGLCRQLDCCVR